MPANPFWNPQHVLLGTLEPGSACQQILFVSPSTSCLELWNQVPHASKSQQVPFGTPGTSFLELWNQVPASKSLLDHPARPSWNFGTRFRMPASSFWNPQHALLGTLEPGSGCEPSSACQQVPFGTPSTSFLELWNQVPKGTCWHANQSRPCQLTLSSWGVQGGSIVSQSGLPLSCMLTSLFGLAGG